MSIKLTDTQLIVLSAAAQREDRCLVSPKNLKGGAAQKFAERLLAAGLVKEIKTKQGAPAWRRDAATAQSYSLKLTAAGLKAIAVKRMAWKRRRGTGAAHGRRSRRRSGDAGGSFALGDGALAGRATRRLEIGAGCWPPPPRSRRDAGRAGGGDRLASAYDARRAHRPAQARLRRHPRAIRQGRGIDLPHRHRHAPRRRRSGHDERQGFSSFDRTAGACSVGGRRRSIDQG